MQALDWSMSVAALRLERHMSIFSDSSWLNVMQRNSARCHHPQNAAVSRRRMDGEFLATFLLVFSNRWTEHPCQDRHLSRSRAISDGAVPLLRFSNQVTPHTRACGTHEVQSRHGASNAMLWRLFGYCTSPGTGGGMPPVAKSLHELTGLSTPVLYRESCSSSLHWSAAE